MLQETLFVKVGGAIAKSILGVWLNDSGALEKLSESAVDIISDLGIEFSAKRRLQRDFDAIADRVGESLVPFFEFEGANLDEGEKNAVALALASTINRTDVRLVSLIENFDLRSNKLSDAFIENGREVLRDFSSDGIQLFHKSSQEASRYIVESAARLPEFTTASFAEVFQRQNTIISLVEGVVAELQRLRETARILNPGEETSKFEQRYRVALSHRNDEVELFGLDAPSKIRRQNLSVAYVTLSMSRRSKLKGALGSFLTRASTKIHDNPIHLKQAILENDALKNAFGNYISGTVEINKTVFISRLYFEESFVRSPKNLRNYLKRSRQEESCDSVIASSPKLLVRGEAGSGKTTLLQWIVVNVASQRMDGILEDWNSSIPFLIRLREYADKPLPSPAEMLKSAVPELADALPTGWVDNVLQDGRGIILIDGVDELDEVKRTAVRDWVRGLTQAFPNCRFILTSRPAAVEENWLQSEGFEEADLLPMSWPDIDNLIDHWHKALEIQPTTTESAKDLAEIADHLRNHLRQNKTLGSLATSPLLCAMLCALHYQRRQQLPSNRIALYDAAIRMLLDQRDRVRGVGPLRLPALSEEQKRAFLEAIAYRMVRNGQTTSPTDDVAREIQRTKRSIQSLPPDAAPDRVLNLLIQRSGIIRSPAEGQVDFVHKSFQEFLCARAVVDAEDLQFLVTQAHNDLWHEVIILAAGLASSKARDELLKGITARGDDEPSVRHKLYLLAVSCLETVITLSPETEMLLNERLARVIPPRTMKDASALKGAGELATPLLRRRSNFSARQAAACVRALASIGTDDALEQLATYSSDTRTTVIRELISGWRSFDYSAYAEKVLGSSPLDDGELTLSNPGRLDKLSLLKHLTYLEVHGARRIESLADLADLKSLKRLQIIELPKVTSLEPLAGLKELNTLSLFGAPELEDIAPLSHLSNLKVLQIGSMPKLKDATCLSALQNLEFLLLSEVPHVTGLDSFDYPETLLSLGIADAEFIDFGRLDRCRRLQRLHILKSKNAEHFETIGRFQDLVSLSLEVPNNTSSLAPLSDLPLQRVDLKNLESVQDVTALRTLKKCLYLDLSGGNSDSLFSEISLLHGLRVLELSKIDGLAIFPALPSLSQLQSLKITDAPTLRDASALQLLTNLHSLDLRGCSQLQSLDFIRPLKKLQTLVIPSDLDHSIVSTASETLLRSGLRVSLSGADPIRIRPTDE